MSDFFRGWRRMIGVVTLLMACVLLVVWMRSMIVGDFVNFTMRGTSYDVRSLNGNLEWLTIHDSKDESPMTWSSYRLEEALRFLEFKASATRERQLALERAKQITEQVNMEGSHEVVANIDKNLKQIHQASARPWAIPYWSLVLPLTALSAFLIITKPRPFRPKSLAEPVPAEGAATSWWRQGAPHST